MQKKIIPIAGAALILGAGLKTLFKSDKTYKSNQELLLEGKLRGYTIFLETLMETLFSEAVKKMVKAFESRANELYS